MAIMKIKQSNGEWLVIDTGASDNPISLADMIIVSATEPPYEEGKIWLKPILEDGETEEM